MSTDVSSLIGLPQETKAARVIRYSYQQYDLILAVSFIGDEAIDIVKEIESIILSAVPFSAEALYSLAMSINERFSVVGSLQYAGVLKNRDQIISIGYNGIVSLVRNSKTGFLIANTESISLVEGKWQEDDVYVIATQSANILFDELYARLQQRYDAKNILQDLSEQFHQSSETAADIITLIQLSKKQEPQEEKRQVQSANFSYQLANTEQEKKAEVIAAPNARIVFSHFAALRQMYVFFKNSRLAKLILAISFIFIVVLICYIFIFFRNRTIKVNALESQLVPIRSEIETIEQSEDTNTFERKNKIEEIIKKLQTLKNETEKEQYLQSIIDNELDRSSSLYENSNKIGTVDAVETYFDASQIKNDFIGTGIQKIGDTIFLLDAGTQQVLSIDKNSKQALAINTSDTNAISLGGSSEQGYLLGNGVYRLSPTETTVTEVIKPDDQNTSSQLIAGFENNIYVLNKSKRNIYRYALTGSEISSPIPWVKATKGLDFDTISDMAIDGKIWLGTNEGKIMVFMQGSQEEFILPELSPVINSTVKLFTSEGDENIYILDTAQKRVVIINKDQSFVREIKNDLFGSAIDLIAFEQDKKIYILNGSLVQEIPF